MKPKNIEKLKLIRDLLNQGITPAQVARAMGMSRQLVDYHISNSLVILEDKKRVYALKDEITN